MSEGPIRLAVIILHYGDPALADRLHAQLAAADPDLAATGHLLVFDNAAPKAYDGAWQRSTSNLYWAGALAHCATAATALGCTHLWFLNNDIAFVSAPPFAARVVARLARMERAEGHPVGVYTPAVVRSPYHPQMVQRPGVQYSRVAIADGIAPVYSLACMNAIGGVDADDNPYGYGVETWLSLRAHRAGWPVVVDHQLVVQHRHHTTARKVDGFMDLAARAEQAYMTNRLGPHWRTTVSAFKEQWTDARTL